MVTHSDSDRGFLPDTLFLLQARPVDYRYLLESVVYQPQYILDRASASRAQAGAVERERLTPVSTGVPMPDATRNATIAQARSLGEGSRTGMFYLSG